MLRYNTLDGTILRHNIASIQRLAIANAEAYGTEEYRKIACVLHRVGTLSKLEVEIIATIQWLELQDYEVFTTADE